MGTSAISKNLKQAVFLDRDGVINDVIDRGENFFVAGKAARFTAPFSYEEFKIKEGVEEAIKKIKNFGWLAILATNQPDIAYGLLPFGEHERIMQDIKMLALDDIYVCFHGRDEGCACKKPKPGMLIAAAEKWNIDLQNSIMIGDSESDAGAAKAAGCKFILIGHESNAHVDCGVRAANIAEAIKKLNFNKYENIY